MTKKKDNESRSVDKIVISIIDKFIKENESKSNMQLALISKYAISDTLERLKKRG